jgi:hypothetical protein
VALVGTIPLTAYYALTTQGLISFFWKKKPLVLEKYFLEI